MQLASAALVYLQGRSRLLWWGTCHGTGSGPQYHPGHDTQARADPHYSPHAQGARFPQKCRYHLWQQDKAWQ